MVCSKNQLKKMFLKVLYEVQYGIGAIPPLLRKDLYDEVIEVREEDAKQMARKLAYEEGVFSGTSTGANVLASLELGKKLKEGSTIVTVAVDTGLKHLRTDPYLKPEGKHA